MGRVQSAELASERGAGTDLSSTSDGSEHEQTPKKARYANRKAIEGLVPLGVGPIWALRTGEDTSAAQLTSREGCQMDPRSDAPGLVPRR